MQQTRKRTATAALVFLTSLAIGFVVTSLMRVDEEEANKPITDRLLTRYEDECDTIQQCDTIDREVVETTLEAVARYKYIDTVRDGDTIYGGGELIGKNEKILAENRYHIGNHQPSEPAPPTPPSPRPLPVDPSPRPLPVDPSHKSSPKPAEPLMSKAELQALINNTNDNILEGIGNDKVSGSLNVKVLYSKQDASNVRRVGGIREKIETGQWRSVQVINMDSDPKTGKITGVTISPIEK